MTDTPNEEPPAVWVISDLTPDGVYVCTIQCNDDTARSLNRNEAIAHASAVHAVAARADYLAALWNLAREKLGMPQDYVREMLRYFIESLPPIDPEPLLPLRLEPGISPPSGSSGVAIWINGENIGHWTPDTARSYASGVLDAAHVVDLDAAMRRMLIGNLGLDADRAGAVVHDLRRFREGSPDETC